MKFLERKMNKLAKKILSIVSNIVSTILFITLICLAIMVVIAKASGGEPELFGYQIKTVLSGSMEPGIQTGSIILVKTGGDMTRFQENDIITFMEEDRLVTHRIIEVIKNGEQTLYRTKGDNNNAPDMNAVMSENVVAEYTGITIPYIGYFVNFAQSKNGAFLLLVPGLILICYSIITIWQAIAALNVIQSRETVSRIEVDGNNTTS